MFCGAYRRGTTNRHIIRGTMRPTLLVAGCVLVCGPLAAGCTGQPVLQPALGVVNPAGPTVTFESIDGPPEAVFHKLVAQLTQEANARRIAVVSRELAAQYRIRGYVAAHVRGKRTTIAWVWDVYNADQQRAMRIAGEEPGSSSLRAWAAADDQTIGHMAQEGMDRLAVFLAAPPPFIPPAPGDQPPPRDVPGPNVAYGPASGAVTSFAAQ
jgi:hypothetical protein